MELLCEMITIEVCERMKYHNLIILGARQSNVESESVQRYSTLCHSWNIRDGSYSSAGIESISFPLKYLGSF